MDHLLTEARNPRTEAIDMMSAVEIVRTMAGEDARVPAAVAAEAANIARVIDIVADRLRLGGRLVYMGAGTSGRLGVLDASECPPTFNSPPGQIVGLIAGGERALTTAVEGAEDHPELALADLERTKFSANDVLVGIATSGRTPYVIAGLRHAREIGAPAIGLACVPDSELVPVADITIAPLVGPEVLTGSTRLKAGTATKLVLNMITTGAMIRLGKAYGNLMVDLRATNVKLRARTNRIVRQLLAIDHARADHLLESCAGELKTAIVVGKLAITPEDARRQLAEVGGRIGELLRRQAPTVDDSLVLGVDGGGTGTTAVLATFAQGQLVELGRGKAGPSNLKAVGMAAAGTAIDTAIDQAFAQAQRPRTMVRSICLGLAGAGRPDDQANVRAWADQRRLATSIQVLGDVQLPLALLPQGRGVAIVAGTGSCVLGRSADGRERRAGGWGPVLGDDGSGYAIALAAVRQTAGELDQGKAGSALGQLIAARLGVGTAAELIATVNGSWDRARLASLATDVLQRASAGDQDAQCIVIDQLAALACSIGVVLNQLDWGHGPVPIALAGGLMRSNYYRERLMESLGPWRDRVEATVIDDPALGAVRLAETMSGRRVASAE